MQLFSAQNKLNDLEDFNFLYFGATNERVHCSQIVDMDFKAWQRSPTVESSEEHEDSSSDSHEKKRRKKKSSHRKRKHLREDGDEGENDEEDKDAGDDDVTKEIPLPRSARAESLKDVDALLDAGSKMDTDEPVNYDV